LSNQSVANADYVSYLKIFLILFCTVHVVNFVVSHFIFFTHLFLLRSTMWTTGCVYHQWVKCGPKCADHFSRPLGKMWTMKMWTKTDTTDQIIREREAEWTDNKGPCDKHIYTAHHISVVCTVLW